jgi:hypothetical protein
MLARDDRYRCIECGLAYRMRAAEGTLPQSPAPNPFE